MTSEQSSDKSINRRRFLQSLFSGISTGSVAESQAANSAEKQHASFFWATLQNGHTGFPTGTFIPTGMPGSIMKLVSAAALHETGLYNGDEKVDCKGSIKIHNETYSCLYPHGPVDLTQALGLSCNVFFALASQKISAHSIVEFARRFGFDTPVDGLHCQSFPSLDHLHFDSTHYALGLATDLVPNALQIMRLAAIVALKGIVPGLHDPGSVEERERTPFHLELQPSTWMILQQGMRLCGRAGTAKHLDPDDKLKLAVKTGTAPHGKAFQSWICGYFPYDNPKHAFCLRSASGTSVEKAVPEAHKWLFSVEWP